MKSGTSYNFLLAAVALCVLGIWIYHGLEAGISGDEYVHLNHANDVLDYYLSFGQDRSALHTPVTNLKYYGQGFDNLAALIIRVFEIDDIFTIRHTLNIVAAWLIVLYVFALGKRIGGLWTGVIAALFLLLSPRFIGHSFNNLKDIPFALAYLMSVYYTIQWIPQLPRPGNKSSFKLIISIAFAISIRPAGLLMICYLGLFSILWCLARRKEMRIKQMIGLLAFIAFCSYFLGLLFWPYALENPLWHPIESHFVMANYPVVMRQLFEGTLYWSDQLPWYYILKYIGITSPLFIIALFLLSPLEKILPSKKSVSKGHLFVMYFVILFPLIFILLQSSNLYGGARHLMFIYPFICVLSALLINRIYGINKHLFFKAGLSLLVIAALYMPAKFIIQNHPLQYAYFNSMVGGIDGAAGKYEVDYYYASLRKGAEQLAKHIDFSENDTIIIASNFKIDWFYKEMGDYIKTIYTPYYKRGEKDWDYGLFVPAHIFGYHQNSLHWPPSQSIVRVEVNHTPICVGVKRKSKLDYMAHQAIVKADYELAIQLATGALKDSPSNLSAYLTLGKAYFHLQQMEPAEQAFNSCLHILPHYEPALEYLANINIKRGEAAKGKQILEEIIESNTRYMQAYMTLADIFLQQGKEQDAIEILELGLKNKPFDKWITEKLEIIQGTIINSKN
ncbi:MAG: tetratricopeptide repeat protein [Carboxylicivirga sp.]|jgi:tetratricopeptide (TPR) repeat protein|nr:tetratricopeptide repeat protein [Carboxylicivirga sp.]